jgi:hypothetical protein
MQLESPLTAQLSHHKLVLVEYGLTHVSIVHVDGSTKSVAVAK